MRRRVLFAEPMFSAGILLGCLAESFCGIGDNNPGKAKGSKMQEDSCLILPTNAHRLSSPSLIPLPIASFSLILNSFLFHPRWRHSLIFPLCGTFLDSKYLPGQTDRRIFLWCPSGIGKRISHSGFYNRRVEANSVTSTGRCFHERRPHQSMG